MPLPRNTRQIAEKVMEQYCRKRVPAHLADEIKAGYRIRGNSITLYEKQRHFSDRSLWVEIVVAQFRFDPKSSYWTLYWPDRNLRWHPLPIVFPSRQLSDLIREVDENPIGAFRTY